MPKATHQPRKMYRLIVLHTLVWIFMCPTAQSQCFVTGGYQQGPSHGRCTENYVRPPELSEAECDVPGATEFGFTALRSLYLNTKGHRWSNNRNWLLCSETITPCEWYGVTCKGRGVKTVVAVSLPDNNLQGIIPRCVAYISCVSAC